jgi:tetratricopeptide (TPR) repeat protein
VTAERSRLFDNARAAHQSAQRFALIPLVAIVLIVAMIGMGCSKEKKAISSIRSSFEAKDYREAIAECRHAIRGGINAPDVYYYYGASLVALGRDFEGFRNLGEAARRDPASSHKIAQFLYENGERSFNDRRRSQAAKRLQKAIEIDPSLELGRYLYMVGDEYYAVKDYEMAAVFYTRAVTAYPDTAAAEEAYFNMGESFAETGQPARARESLEKMLELNPEGQMARHARWTLVNLMYDQGEKQFLMGNHEEVIEIVTELLARTRNRGIVQKSRFLLGETYEALGEFDSAYAQYQAIIEVDRGASGRIVERARSKIAALREAGLH